MEQCARYRIGLVRPEERHLMNCNEKMYQLNSQIEADIKKDLPLAIPKLNSPARAPNHIGH